MSAAVAKLFIIHCSVCHRRIVRNRAADSARQQHGNGTSRSQSYLRDQNSQDDNDDFEDFIKQTTADEDDDIVDEDVCNENRTAVLIRDDQHQPVYITTASVGSGAATVGGGPLVQYGSTGQQQQQQLQTSTAAQAHAQTVIGLGDEIRDINDKRHVIDPSDDVVGRYIVVDLLAVDAHSPDITRLELSNRVRVIGCG